MENLLSFGDLLKTFRQRQHLTQQELAGQLGVHRNTIGIWERGDYLPGSKTLVLELAHQLGLAEPEMRQLLEASLTALSPYWSVPLPRNLYFTGREAVLETLHTQLSVERALALTQSAALHGLGGVGKTQIALEYAYRYALEYSAVFWLGAETQEELLAGLVRIASVLQLPEQDDREQQRVVEAVQRWLSTHDQWLVILDNVEELDVLDHVLPATRQGAVLLTTRLQTLGTRARGLDQWPMEQEEGTLFLLRRAKVLAPEATTEEMQELAERMPEQYAAAVELVEHMGGLPLALDQAGAYLEATHCGLPAYLERFRTQQTTLLKLRGEGVREHPASVSTTFRLAFAATTRSHPAVEDLLRVCALVQPDAIPEELFLQAGEHLGPQLQTVGRDGLEWDRVIATACAYSLLQRQPGEQTLLIHRLVQAVLLDTMTQEEREQWNCRIIKALDTVFPAGEHVTWKQCERLLPHALLCLHRSEAAEESLIFASLACKVAQYLREREQYTEAKPLYQRALQIREQRLGPDHPEVAQVLSNMATLSWRQGQYAKAEVLYQRALQIWRQSLGSEHPQVAQTLSNLALLSWTQGKYTEAEPLYWQAVQIFEQSLGPEHLQLAPALNNLAILSWTQGKYTEAEPLYQRALRIWEQALGPEHPKVASALNGLAGLYMKCGKYEQAEPLCQRAVRIREQTLGPEHSQVAILLNNLAEIYLAQGKYTEAEPLYQRALHIWEQALGPEHSQVAESLNNQADLYLAQGKYTEAEPLYQRALQIFEQSLGPEHSQVAEPLNGLADLYLAQGKYTEAEPLYQRALHIWEQALGPEHPNVAESLNGLANLFRERSHYPEAERLYRCALSLREQHLGQQHPETAQTLHDLAMLRQKQGNLNEALSFVEHALSIRLQSLGGAHPKTVTTRTLHAQLLQEQMGAQEEVTAERTSEAKKRAKAPLPLDGEADPLTPENDHLQRFLDACCERHPRAWCHSADLWQAYVRWAEQQQERFPLSQRAFHAQLRRAGCHPTRTNTARLWRGITLCKPEP